MHATLSLLYVHGRAVTTKQIAEAGGVAEGTIFRVFDSKDELIDAAVAEAFAPGQLAVRITEIDPDQPLRERLLKLVSVLQQRFRAMTGLMHALGQLGPPKGHHDADRRAATEESTALMVALIDPEADRLSVAPEMFVHMLRMLTFAGSSEQVSGGQVLTPEQIVDTLLYGVLKKAV